MEFDARRARAFGFERDADDIETKGLTLQAEQPTVDARGASDLASLAPIDVSFGRGETVGDARLHFDETERWAIVGDEIDFVLHERAARIPSDGQFEVRCYQSVAVGSEVSGGHTLAARADI